MSSEKTTLKWSTAFSIPYLWLQNSPSVYGILLFPDEMYLQNAANSTIDFSEKCIYYKFLKFIS